MIQTHKHRYRGALPRPATGKTGSTQRSPAAGAKLTAVFHAADMGISFRAMTGSIVAGALVNGRCTAEGVVPVRIDGHWWVAQSYGYRMDDGTAWASLRKLHAASWLQSDPDDDYQGRLVLHGKRELMIGTPDEVIQLEFTREQVQRGGAVLLRKRRQSLDPAGV